MAVNLLKLNSCEKYFTLLYWARHSIGLRLWDVFDIDHAMICRRGGFIIQRHNEFRDLEA